MAKKKKTVASSARKRKTATGTTTDKCRPLREQIERVREEIAQIREDLGEPDIPPALRARLKALLKKNLELLARLSAALRICEKLPDRTRLK